MLGAAGTNRKLYIQLMMTSRKSCRWLFLGLIVAAAECASDNNSSCEVRTGSDRARASMYTIDEEDSSLHATSLLQVRQEFSTKKRIVEQSLLVGHGPSSRVELTCGDFNNTVWQDYAKFHRAGREALARGESRPALIWQCTDEDTCGGNGDQVKLLLWSFLFAVKTNRVFLIGAWSKSNFNIHSLFDTSRIDVYFDSVPLSCRETRVQHGEIGILRLLNEPCLWVASSQFTHKAMLSDEVLTPLRHIGHEDASSLLALSNQSTQISTQMPMLGDDVSTLGCAFHFLLEPSRKYRTLQAARMPSKAGNRYISVHVRMGDYVMDNGSSSQSDVRLGLANESLAAALRCALQVPVVADTILVFSDSAEVKSLAVNDTWVSDVLGSAIAGYKVDTSRDAEGNVYIPKHTALDHGANRDGVISAWADQAIVADSVAVVMTTGGFASAASMMGLVPIIWTASKDGQCKAS